MVKEKWRKFIFVLSGISAVLTLIVSASGILDPDIYLPMTPENLIPGAVSQDIVSFISAIGIILSLLFAKKGSDRAWLVWTGFTGYLLYAYGIYSFDRVYNFFFLIYIAIFGLALYSLILFFTYTDFRSFKRSPERKLPRRTAGAYLILLVIMFLMIWLSIIIPGMAKNNPPDGNSIFIFDLSFFLPLLVIAAFQLFRKIPFGDILASILLLKMGILGISVLLGELIRPIFSQVLDPPMIVIFTILGIGGLIFALLFLKRLGTLSPDS